MSEPKRYERCYHKDYIPEGMEEHYNGKWVKWEDYARLKAEVERLTAFTTRTIIPNEELQAQVERLTAENESLQTKATNIYNAMVVRCRLEEITHKANADSIISQGMMSEAMKLMEESIAIREQVERLTKAGDALENWIAWVCESPVGTAAGVRDAWDAAKEGKQS